MKKPQHHIALIVVLFLLIGCLEQIELEQIDSDQLLVVEATITDQPVKQQVRLSRTVPLNSDQIFVGLSDAEVWIEDDQGNRVNFSEVDPGIYETENTFSAQMGVSYQLNIETANGKTYQSEPSAMVRTSPIDSVYAQFTPFENQFNPGHGRFNFYLDARSNPSENRFFKWEWNSTYEVQVPQPSRWLWTGGETFIIRERGSVNDSLQVEICWNHNRSKNLLLEELLPGENQVIAQPLHQFNSLDSPQMKVRYSIEVKQYALTERSYNYWELVRESTSGSGFLFDTQVGSIRGNVFNPNNDSEIVLGYFDVLQEQSKREFFTPAEFRQKGFTAVKPFIVECADEDTVMTEIDQIGTFMEENQDRYTLCYFQTGPPKAIFCLLECAECTLYSNSNREPDYW